MSFKICQWNCRSAVANKNNLDHLLQQNEISIAFLSETWFKPQVFYNFPGYNCARVDRDDGRGGVAILLKSSIPYTDVPLKVPTNIVAKSVCVKTSNNINLTLVSLYIKPQSKIPVHQWNAFFSSIPRPSIVAGDFNAHHQAWGCEFEDGYGKILMDAVDYSNLTYLNTGAATLVKKLNNRKSAVDITLCSPELAHFFTWKVIDDPHGSDHLPIIIECNFNIHNYIGKTHKIWNTHKANWKEYRAHMENTEESTDYNQLVAKMQEAATEAIPKIKTPKNRNIQYKGKQWWNDKCENAVKNRRNHYLVYKENPNLENLIKYKRHDALAKKIINETKKQSWKDYCSSLNKDVPIKEIWCKLNKFKNRKQSNQIPHDTSNWIDKFHAKLAPQWVNTGPNTRVETNSSYPQLLKPFTISELHKALQQNNDTSPGLDNIHYSMLAQLSSSAKQCLLNIYNKIWANEITIPPSWYEYLMIPILKSGKSKNQEDSYRPIALASCVMKTYERLIKNRLEHWLEQNDLLPSFQYGFRKGRSTQEAVANLVTDVQLAFTKNHSVTALFLDIKGAYDNVILELLAKKLIDIGVPNKITNNIITLYTNRQIFIKTNEDIIGPRTTSLGLPQGSILSPLLFIIYTSEFGKNFDPNLRVLQFADDFCIYYENSNIDYTINKLSVASQEIKKWSSDLGFSISEEKSAVCTFSRRRYQLPNKINLGPYEFPCKNSIKYLGIVLDKKLIWKDHINHLTKKCENAINILRVFCKHKWGADPNIALIFYKSLVRSILDYGSIFYGNTYHTHLKKIDLVRNKCLRLCLGLLRSTPINVLEVESGEPPLEFRRQFLSDKFTTKMYSKNSTCIRNLHQLAILGLTSTYWKNKKLPLMAESYTTVSDFTAVLYNNNKIPCYTIAYEVYQQTIITHYFKFKDVPKLDINRYFDNELKTRWNNHQYIFTDGSKMKNGTGCAFFHSNDLVSKKYKLPDVTSIYTAELIAIREAMKYALQHHKSHFVIFTDSKSSVDKLKNIKISAELHNIIVDILTIHEQLYINKKLIVVSWIKGHSGIRNNEIVDQLAKAAVTSGNTIQNDILPPSELISLYKISLNNKWQHKYDEVPTGLSYKQIQPIIPKKPWYHIISHRPFIQTISRIRTKHALYPQHKHKIGLLDTPACSCGKTGDLQHVILECPLKIQHIHSLYTELIKNGVELPINLDSLLCNGNISIYQTIYNLVRKAKVEL